ncbi:MAG: serine protease, partial [Xenococcus sp. (in: cyanobacteria)]
DSLSSDYDLALITLDRNIGDHIGYFGYDTNSYEGLNVNSAGYPADLANSWTWEDGYHVPFEDTADVDLYKVFGPITDIVGQTLRYELDTSGGQSGSPVWRYDQDSGNRYVVGVHTSGTSSYNVAAQLTSGKINTIEDEINNSSVPIDRPDFVDYDEWFGTNFAYFQNNTRGGSINDSSNAILNVKAGDFITFRSVIRNNGTAKVDNNFYFTEPTIDVSFFASTNDFITDSDYKLGEVTISAIDPFAWRDVYLDTVFPNIPEGYYSIGYTFDSVTSEFDTSNNQGLIDDSLIYVI